MAKIGKYVQTMMERKRYLIDYSDWLDHSEGINSVIFDPIQVTDPPLVIDDAQITTDGVSVQYYISGGLTGITYEVVARITTNMTQTKEDSIMVSIREP